MPRNKSDTERVNTYMPRRLMAAARKLATLRGISYSEMMRTALTEYIQREIEREHRG